MSLISDALKKAQAEREGLPAEGASRQPHTLTGGPHPSKPLWKSPLILLAGLALVAGLLGVWLTRPGGAPVTGNMVPLIVTTKDSSPQSDTPPPVEQGEPLSQAVVAVEPNPPAKQLDSIQPEPRAQSTMPMPPVQSENRVQADPGKTVVSADDELAISLRTAETADDYVRLYQMLKRRNDPQAFDMVKKGLDAFPQHGVLNQLALIGCVRNRDYSQALIHAEVAINQDSDQPSLLTYRGLCYFHQKDYPRALADFGRSLALDPKATENIYYLALIYDGQGQYELAIQYYRMFMDRHPQNRSFRHKEYIVDRLGQLTRQRSGK